MADQTPAGAGPIPTPGQPPEPAQGGPDQLSMAWLLPLLPAGFIFGLVGGFVQEHRWVISGVEVPWAAVLLCATLVAAVRALALNLETRKAGALFFIGWLVATALLALPNPSGDVVFSADWGTYLYLGGSALLGASAAAWPIARFTEPGEGTAPAGSGRPPGPAA